MELDWVERAKAYAENILKGEEFDRYPYHNLRHTGQVVDAVRIVARQTELNETEIEIATVAAWFHDLGYLRGANNHEHRSAQMAKEALTQWGVSEELQSEVVQCILATKIPQTPLSLSARVLCDADLFHLSTGECLEHTRTLRKEAALNGNKVSIRKWYRSTLKFLKEHQYHTPYGKKVLQKGKKANIMAIKEKLEVLKAKRMEKERLKGEQMDLENEIRGLLSLAIKADQRATVLLLVGLFLITLTLIGLLVVGLGSRLAMALGLFTVVGFAANSMYLRGLQTISGSNLQLSGIDRKKSLRKEFRRVLAESPDISGLYNQKDDLRRLVSDKVRLIRSGNRILIVGGILIAVAAALLY